MAIQIIELTLPITEDGLKLGAAALQEMGLCPGNTVCLAYLSQGYNRNDSQEFWLTPNGFEAESQDEGQEDYSITLPNEILNAAQIPWDSKLAIYCLDSTIVICRENQCLKELKAVLEQLQLANSATAELEELMEED